MQFPAIRCRSRGTLAAGHGHRGPGAPLGILCALAIALSLSSCSSTGPKADLVISSVDQKMAVIDKGALVREYKISTSKFGVGDQRGSYRTPPGRMTVASKIGKGLPQGAVLKSRRPTGEILKPNSPGRDPIVTRILWLKGTESQNANAYGRCIYIHGTPEERTIGRPSSYGCIRMRSRDVVDLYNRVGVGSNVYVTTSSLESPSSARRFGSSGSAGGGASTSGREILERAVANTGSRSPAYLEEKAKPQPEPEPAIVVKKAKILAPAVMTAAKPPRPAKAGRRERSLLDPFGILPGKKGKGETASRRGAAAEPVVEKPVSGPAAKVASI